MLFHVLHSFFFYERAVFFLVLLVCSVESVRTFRNGTVCNVESFGAIGDGKTLSTSAIRAAFDNATCSTVLIPAGKVFLTGALNWTRSDASLQVDGTLLASTNSSLFPLIPEVPSYPCDRDRCFPLRHNPVLLLFNVSRVRIVGAGTIDGQGSPWWARHAARKTTAGRPRLLQTMYSQDLLIANLTLKDSPFWTTHIWNSQRVEVAFVKVSSPRSSPNTDGVDPDSSEL